MNNQVVWETILCPAEVTATPVSSEEMRRDAVLRAIARLLIAERRFWLISFTLLVVLAILDD